MQAAWVDLAASGAVRADYDRACVGMPLAMVLSLGGLTVAALADDPIIAWMLALACVATSAACALCWARLRRRRATAPRDDLVLAVMLCSTAVLGVAALGPLSAAVVFLFLLVYAFGLNRSEALAWAVWSTCALGYVLIAAWSEGATVRGVAITIIVEVVLMGTFLHAQRNRRALTSSIAHVLAMREALDRATSRLEQARAEADDAYQGARLGTRTGETIGGYRVGEVIGRGGMGEVYRAWKGDDAQPVALKLLPRSKMQNPQHVQRFIREAKHASQLASRHIVRVHEAGCTDGGTPFLAMELLRGRDLAQVLDKKQRLSLRETVQLVSDVSRALDAAHAAGIIHRDIKPQNVFLSTEDGEPCWKVLDFGVSTGVDSNGTLTQGGIVGTAGYISPEQVCGDKVDHRTDIFALGAIAYRALTGEPAFHAEDGVGALLQVLHLQPFDPRLHADVPDDVCHVLAIALSKARGSRFQSGAEMRRAFEAAAQNALPAELRVYARMLLAKHPWTEPLDDAPASLPESVHIDVDDDADGFTVPLARAACA